MRRMQQVQSSRFGPQSGPMQAGRSPGFTSEVKFVVDRSLGVAIGDWARQHLAADPHGSGPFADEYRVTSLYLDTEARDVFHRRASYGRSKYRLRRYLVEPTVYLERKLRTAARLAKRRSAIDLATLPLLGVEHALNGDGTAWFRRRVAIRQLQPVCQVSYLRMARAGDTPDGPARLTLDHTLAAVTTGTFSFDATPAVALLEDAMILELKFRGRVPAVFKRLVETFALRPGRASKYRIAAGALGLVEGDRQGASPIAHA